MDLISREELLNNPPDIYKVYDGIGIPKEGYTKEQIKKAPAVPAIPISVIEGIKAEIENIPETRPTYPTDSITTYLLHRTGASVKNEVLRIIDKHIKEYTK